jgi:hypothetical protein
MKRIGVSISLLTVLVAVTACNASESSRSPVRVYTPREGETLMIGQPFRVIANIEVDYQFEYTEIVLQDVYAGYSTTWKISNPSKSKKAAINEVFVVPENAPPGDDYRLQVEAYPGKTVFDRSGAAGYSVPVKVANAP